MPASARQLRIAAFRELFDGRAPTLPQLTARLGLDEAQAAAVLDRLAERGMVVVEGQRVMGSLGLCLRTTRQRVELAGRVVHTW